MKIKQEKSFVGCFLIFIDQFLSFISYSIYLFFIFVLLFCSGKEKE